MLISKELYLEKPLTAGYYPVVIRVSHLGKERIVETSVECLRKHWDSGTKTIRRQDVAHFIKNIQIDSVYRRVVENIQNYLDKILAENLELLLNIYKPDNNKLTKEEKRIEKTYFSDLIEKKISSVESLNTRRSYKCFLNYFRTNFGKGPSIDTISQDFINTFRATLENDYPALSSMRMLHASHLKAVISFGKETGQISQNFIPKLPTYSFLPTDRNLSESELRHIYQVFQKRVRDDPKIKKQETLSLALFILSIAFQGLAPTDITSLRISDLSFLSIILDSNISAQSPEESLKQPTDIVNIRSMRNKTGVPLTITTVVAPIKIILLSLMEGKTQDDFLIPCFDKNREYSQEQKQNRLANYYKKMMRIMNETLASESTFKIRPKITYYFARHAYCNLVDSLDIPRHLIQYLIGHRVTVLERNYLRRITSSEQAAISQRVFTLLCPDTYS